MQSHTFAQGLNEFTGLVKLQAKERWRLERLGEMRRGDPLRRPDIASTTEVIGLYNPTMYTKEG